jgi:hypothetical protein
MSAFSVHLLSITKRCQPLDVEPTVYPETPGRHDVENWKLPEVGLCSKDTQVDSLSQYALAVSMLMPLWLGSSLRPEHAMSAFWVQATADAAAAVGAEVGVVGAEVGVVGAAVGWVGAEVGEVGEEVGEEAEVGEELGAIAFIIVLWSREAMYCV